MATSSVPVASPPLPSVSRSSVSTRASTSSSARTTLSSQSSASRPSASLSQPPAPQTSTPSSAPPQTTATRAADPAPTTTDASQTNPQGSQKPKSVASVAGPIVGVIGGIVLIYILYKLYQRRWRRKQEANAPLPPPRLPAVLENSGRAVSFYGGSTTYETAMLPYAGPVSLAPSNSSSLRSDIDSKPVALSPGVTDESVSTTGRQSPLPLPIPRRRPPPAQPRPQSVLSTSRYSTYSVAPTVRSTGPIRGAPHQPHNRIDIVLPQPLAGGPAPAPPLRPYSNYSIANPNNSYTDVRNPSRKASTESWIERASSDHTASSSNTVHGGPKDEAAPPPPWKQPPPVPRLPSSVAGPVPNRAAVASPPLEPLLSSAVFGSGSLSGSGSDHSNIHPQLPPVPPPRVPQLPRIPASDDGSLASLAAVQLSMAFDSAPPVPKK